MGKDSGNRAVRLPGALRPLLYWLFFVLALFGWHQYQELLERTRLHFAVALPSDLSAYETVAVTLDGLPVGDEQRYGIGTHTFKISGAKIEPFVTNFFGWYGGFSLGRIRLKRAMGTLSVSASPPASVITITGPEFSTLLSNSVGTNISVPTDTYAVIASYPHWSQSRNVMVDADQTTACDFTPQLGALRLTCNRDGAKYTLRSGDLTLAGDLPATLDGLPTGQYQLTANYHRRQVGNTVAVEASVTNYTPLQFALGALRIESVPSGASVSATNGDYLGQTPVVLLDLPPQTATLSLSLYGYEPAALAVEVAADRTNDYGTNLMSVGYAPAMRDARAALAAGNYGEAARTATQALSAMPDDVQALALREAANDRLTVQRQAAEGERKEENEREARLKRPREAFDGMCRQNPDAGLFAMHELRTSFPAKAVAAAIAKSLSSEPHPFKVQYSDSPGPGIYEMQVGQTFSLPMLGGSERACLVVVGQAKPDETQIYFKVLEYQIQSTIQGNGLFDFRDNKQLIPVSPSKVQMTDVLQQQLQDGMKLVRDKIQEAIKNEE